MCEFVREGVRVFECVSFSLVCSWFVTGVSIMTRDSVVCEFMREGACVLEFVSS